MESISSIGICEWEKNILCTIRMYKILLSDELKNKCENGYHAGVMSGAFSNTDDIRNSLGATTVDKFFDIIINEVKKNYE